MSSFWVVGASVGPPLSDSVVLSKFPSLSLFPHLSDGVTQHLPPTGCWEGERMQSVQGVWNAASVQQRLAFIITVHYDGNTDTATEIIGLKGDISALAGLARR